MVYSLKPIKQRIEVITFSTVLILDLFAFRYKGLP